jgi:CPA1 family monovalent cation:H+ antiporter
VLSAETRIQAQAVWNVIVFLLNSTVFILIGLELSDVLDRLTPYGAGDLVYYAVVVSAAAILVRFAWVFPATYLPRWVSRRIRETDPVPPWQHIVIVSWAGMRGIVSLAAALALPYLTRDGTAFPARDLIVFLSFAVIFATLVLQGTTLGLLIRWLGVGADSSEEEEERQARIKTAYAAVAELDRLAASGSYEAHIVEPVRAEYNSRIIDCDVGKAARGDGGGATADRRSIRLQVVAAERRRLIKLRRDRLIGDEVLHRIQRELDLEELRLS